MHVCFTYVPLKLDYLTIFVNTSNGDTHMLHAAGATEQTWRSSGVICERGSNLLSLCVCVCKRKRQEIPKLFFPESA